MVRIADATGIPLDSKMQALTGDIRRDLSLNDYASADNTPQLSKPAKLLGRVLAPVAQLAFRARGMAKSNR